MKKYILLLPLIFCCLSIFCQSNHTVTFSGSSSDFNTAEKYTAAANSTDYYITFDATYLYLGAFRTSGTFGTTDNFAIYIDTDPNSTPTSGTGTTSGQSYNGVSGSLPFTANYDVHAELSYQEARSFGASWASTIAGLTYNTSTTCREVRIPFSSIGTPNSLYLTMWMGYGTGFFSNVPGSNISASGNPTITEYFGGFGVSTADCIPKNTTNTAITDLIANGVPASGAVYGRVNVTTGTITNSNNFTIAPGGSITVSGGTFAISGQTITMGSATTAAGKGTLINTSGAGAITTTSASIFNFGGEGTITGNNLSINGTIKIRQKFTPLASGGLTFASGSSLEINSGGFVSTNAPTYGSGSTLIYNSLTTYNRSLEWSATTGAGYPYNVLVGNGNSTTLDMNNGANLYRKMAGNLTISSGATFDINGITGQNGTTGICIEVVGDISNSGTINFSAASKRLKCTNFTNNGTTNLSVTSGGDLELTGNFINNATFSSNTRAVFFTGAGTTQDVSGSATPPFKIDYVVVNKSSGFVRLLTDLLSEAPNTGNAITLTNTTDILDLNGHTFTMGKAATSSTISGNGFIRGSSSSNLTILGTGAFGTINFDQTTDGTTNVLNDMTVNRTATGTLSLGSKLVIINSYTPTAGVLTTGGFLHLRSSSSKTARIGQGSSSGGYITGNVTVERYIPNNANRAWRLLSVPASGQTFHTAWQENQAAGSTTPASYGTQITSSSASWSANGFDFQSNGNSLLTYVPSAGGSGSFAGVSNTANNIATTSGYMLFVRGDRTALPSNSTISATTLRTTGSLYEGTQTATTVPSTEFALIGNPFASQIDLTLLTRGADIDNIFYVWDPLLTGNYGLGGFQTFNSNGAGSYTVTPGGGSYTSPPYKTIESGQAFFVHASGGATNTIAFSEAAKSTGSGMVFGPTVLGEQLVTNLYSVNGAIRSLADGTLNLYDNSYSNAVDNQDALKLSNLNLNLGMLRNAKNLVVEKRQIIGATDSIFFNLSGAAQQQYQLEFVASGLNHPGLLGKLVDSYLGTSTAVNLDGTTTVDFTITADPASSIASRFMLVFYPAAPLPVTFTSIKAYQTTAPGGQGSNAAVEWKVANEINIQKYEVERSTDGTNFIKLATQAATGNGGSDVTYNWIDINPVTGDNFYRVRSSGISGDIKYSSIVKVKVGKGNPVITVYPNPVINKTMSIQFSDMAKGNYQLRLINTIGQTVFTQQLTHTGANGSQTVGLGTKLAAGSYRLEIIKPDNSRIVQAITIKE